MIRHLLIGRRSWRLPFVGLFLFVTAGNIGLTHGQEAEEESQARKAERAESLREMKNMVGTVKVATVIDGNRVESSRLAKPILHYYDQPRKILDATLWCFAEQGRPAAFCKIEKISVADRSRWLYCFASLSTAPVEAEWEEGKKFASQGPGIRFFDLPGAPAPADTRGARFRQAKDLIRRITVSLADPDLAFRENLRLLTQPLHRYEDPATGILEGTVFGFSTNGTCPDLIVLLEAQKSTDGPATWKVAAARMTNCELRLRDGDREVWNVPFLRFSERLGENLETWMFFWAADSR